MANKNFIQRATDYFGVAYYSFLVGYAVYEFILGREFVSILVIGPLFYTFTIYGLIEFLLIPYVAVASLSAGESEGWERIKTNFSVGLFSLGFATWVGLGYLSPTEQASLIEAGSLIFILIVVSEILIRVLLHPLKKEGKRSFLERVNKVGEVYPMGAIAVVGFFAGIMVLGLLYMPTDRSDLESVTLSGGITFIISLLIIEWINRKLGKASKQTLILKPVRPSPIRVDSCYSRKTSNHDGV